MANTKGFPFFSRNLADPLFTAEWKTSVPFKIPKFSGMAGNRWNSNHVRAGDHFRMPTLRFEE